MLPYFVGNLIKQNEVVMNKNLATGNNGEEEAVMLRSTAIYESIDDIQHSILQCNPAADHIEHSTLQCLNLVVDDIEHSILQDNPTYSVSDLLQQQQMAVMDGISV